MTGRVQDLEQARALLEKQKLVPMVAAGKLLSLVEAIAGEPVAGSWWGHPAGKAIFRIANELEDAEVVLVAKVLEGKVTFVDRALFGPIYRIVTDRTWREAATRALREDAREVLAGIKGETRIDMLDLEKKTLAKIKSDLEKSLLVRSKQIHTDRGAHATVFEPWSSWASFETKAAARKLNLASAQDAVRAVSDGLKTPLLDFPGAVTKN